MFGRNNKDNDESRAVTRRQLIRWAAFTGAVMGLPRWRVFEALELAGGTALAQEAACATTARSVHLVAGTGGFAWFQLLWPHNDVAAAGNGGFAFHAPGEQTIVPGTDRTLTLGPEAPWRGLEGRINVTAFMAGNNETHTNQPTSNSTLGNGNGLFAAATALQTSSPTLVPVIAIDDVPFGNAAGAPRPARVGNADAIVSLFDSAASRMGGALFNPADAALYDTSYRAFLALNAQAGRGTTTRAFETGKTAGAFLGRNLADLLTPRPSDFVRYGVDAGTANKIAELAKALIITAKAFAMGLTSSVIVPCFRDDPHGAFNDMGVLRQTTRGMGMALDAFRNDLASLDDPSCAGHKLADNLVISIHGDTPKNPLDRSGWPDGTPGNANWVYVLGSGYLKTGWFGGIDRGGNVTGFNPATGNDAGFNGGQTAQAATAAICYAIAKGDKRRLNDVIPNPVIEGITRPVLM
jgi:hypothetical protein